MSYVSFNQKFNLFPSTICLWIRPRLCKWEDLFCKIQYYVSKITWVLLDGHGTGSLSHFVSVCPWLSTTNAQSHFNCNLIFKSKIKRVVSKVEHVCTSVDVCVDFFCKGNTDKCLKRFPSDLKYWGFHFNQEFSKWPINCQKDNFHQTSEKTYVILKRFLSIIKYYQLTINKET